MYWFLPGGVCLVFASPFVLVRIIIAAMKYHNQKNSKLGGNGSFCLHIYSAVHHYRKSGRELKQCRNLEAGADAEAIEGCCILACFHCDDSGFCQVDIKPATIPLVKLGWLNAEILLSLPSYSLNQQKKKDSFL